MSVRILQGNSESTRRGGKGVKIYKFVNKRARAQKWNEFRVWRVQGQNLKAGSQNSGRQKSSFSGSFFCIF